MSTGIRKLAKLQAAVEVTPGTPVTTATMIWRGQGGMLEDQRKIEWIDELCGIFNGLDRTVTTQLLGALQLADTSLTAEQLQYLFVMGMNGPTTGSTDGVGTDKIFVNTLPTTTFVTPKSYTWQGGDNFEAEVMEYSLCTKVTISGDVNTYAKMGGLLMGRQVSYKSGGLTSAIAVPVVGDYAVNNGKVYADAIGGTYGTTAIGGQILGFKIEYDFLWKPQFGMAGQLFYQQALYTGHTVKGSLTFIHDANASGTGSGQKTVWRAETPQKLRIDLVGPAVGTPGTTYSNKHVIIDAPCKLVKASPLSDKDGMDVLTFDFDSRYNLTAADGGKVTTVSETTPLP